MRLGHRAYWSFNLFPGAAEGGGCFVPTLRAEPLDPRGGPVDLERSKSEAARRARASVRRYGAANRLSRLWTLTYAGEGCFDQTQIRSDLGEFFRGLRAELGKPFPYVWVPEWHPGGHGLHAHFTVGQFIPVRLIKEVWGHGIVHGKLIGDLPVGSGTLEEARAAAGYLGKYLTKGFGEERLAGLHRYEVAQGFQPEKVPLRAESDEAVIGKASELMGSQPARVWRSSESEDWRGSPAYWCAWAER